MYINLIASSRSETKVTYVSGNYHNTVGVLRLNEPFIFDTERYYFAVSKFNINTDLLPYCLLEISRIYHVGDVDEAGDVVTTPYVELKSTVYLKYKKSTGADVEEEKKIRIESSFLRKTTGSDEVLTRPLYYGNTHFPFYSTSEFNAALCRTIQHIRHTNATLKPLVDGRLGFRLTANFKVDCADNPNKEKWIDLVMYQPFYGDGVTIEVRGEAVKLFNIEYDTGGVEGSVSIAVSDFHVLTQEIGGSIFVNPNTSYIEYGEPVKRTIYTECKALLICTENLPCKGELFPEVTLVNQYSNRLDYKVVSTLIPMPTSNEDMHAGIYYSNENIRDGDRIPMTNSPSLDGFSFIVLWLDGYGMVRPLYAPPKALSLVRFYFGLKTKY